MSAETPRARPSAAALVHAALEQLQATLRGEPRHPGCEPIPALRARLRAQLGLSALDIDLLLVALAAELGRPLHGPEPLDVRALLALLGGDADAAARVIERLQQDRPLRLGCLLELEGGGSLAARTIRLSQSFWPYLLDLIPGGALLPADALPLSALVLPTEIVEASARAVRFVERSRTRSPVLVVAGPAGSGRETLARAILAGANCRTLVVDGATLGRRGAGEVARDAAWHDAAVVLTDCSDEGACLDLALRSRTPLAVSTEQQGVATVLDGASRPTLVVALPFPSAEARTTALRGGLHAAAVPLGEVDARSVAKHFAFGFGATVSTVRLAVARAEARGTPLTTEDLKATARRLFDHGLGEHVQRVDTTDLLHELVTTPTTASELSLVSAWLQTAAERLAPDGPGARAGAGAGLTCLFHGPPGTGKTTAARHIAARAGLDLLRIDLAQVVDKYIGETEKRLDAAFRAAAATGSILLFDEADALFGRRTEVKDSTDRYANLQTGFLLQRLEAHSGLAILTSNLTQSFDPAFLRRIQVVAHFPLPGPGERRALWEQHLPAARWRAADLDLGFLCERLPASGGDIRNAVLVAVLLLGPEQPLGMRELVIALCRELRKAGRLIDAQQLGPWSAVVREQLGA